MNKSLGEIAQLLGGNVVGDAATRITGVNGIQEAETGELCFIRAPRYLPYLETTQASAVLMAKAPENCPIPAIEVEKPELAFAMVLKQCETEATHHPEGIHESAVIDPSVQLGENVGIDALVRIAPNCVIGAGTVIYAGTYIGRDTVIGADSLIYPNVTIREKTILGERCVIHSSANIGSDGFGFAPMGGEWMKIPQVGRVIIGDDVEVGSGTCIDRATFGVTRIGKGTKIDNMNQIGHNVQIGEHCVSAGMVGIAGSTHIGNHVRLGPNCGINGHITIEDNVSVVGRTSVAKSLEAGRTVSGYPADDHAVSLRILLAQKRLPDALKRIRQLERDIERLKEQVHD